MKIERRKGRERRRKRRRKRRKGEGKNRKVVRRKFTFSFLLIQCGWLAN